MSHAASLWDHHGANVSTGKTVTMQSEHAIPQYSGDFNMVVATYRLIIVAETLYKNVFLNRVEKRVWAIEKEVTGFFLLDPLLNIIFLLLQMC